MCVSVCAYVYQVVVHNGFLSWPVEDSFPPSETQFGIHAGGIETSVMLHLNPELVRGGMFFFGLVLCSELGKTVDVVCHFDI